MARWKVVGKEEKKRGGKEEEEGGGVRGERPAFFFFGLGLWFVGRDWAWASLV